MIKRHKVRMIMLFGIGIVLTLGLYGCATQNISTEPEKEEQETDTSLSENIKNQKSDVEDKKEQNHINDLLFRKYNIGYSMDEGTVIIQKDVVLQTVSTLDSVVVIFYNDQILETLPFEGEDLIFKIEKGGHYCFFLLNSDKTLIDISGKVASYKSIEDSIVTPLDD